MTTSVQLDEAMRGVPGWRGCVPVDVLGPRLKPGECCIINLERSDQPGSHWVSASRQTKHVLYFDPFGAEPDDRVLRWLGHPFENRAKYQQVDSEQCGQFNVFVLRHVAEDPDLYNLLYKLLRPGGENEAVVRRYFNSLTQKTSPPSMAVTGRGIADTAYCMKCRAQKPMNKAHAVTMKNGRHAVAGVCASCGTKMFRIVAGTRAHKGTGLFLA